MDQRMDGGGGAADATGASQSWGRGVSYEHRASGKHYRVRFHVAGTAMAVGR